jgi:O-acetyl-ADP-ribose deacetylase (regulator of RNase III)
MLIYRRTSVLESSAQTLVNTVNCVGVMGKGIAKAFKDRDPAMFAAYKAICDRKLLQPGKLWLWQGTDGWVLNFPTKIHWRNPSRLEWIEAGLEKFVAEYAKRGIKEISFPRLGCGNGGLDWHDVKPVMEHYLSDLDIPVYIHDYTVDIGIPEHLERVAEQLRREATPLSSFDGFLANLRRTIELADCNFEDLSSHQPFTARLDNDNLVIGEDSASWIVEPEDLRGVWVSLLSGIVTRDKAGWSVRESGDALISLLSILPQVRPIEIQRGSSNKAEVAAEFRPGVARAAPAPASGEQCQLSWA